MPDHAALETCPACNSSKHQVRESRRCKNGCRRRRHQCIACGYRWTTWDGIRPDRTPPRPTKGKVGRLSDDQIRIVLLAPASVSHVELGRQMGLTGESIRQIRNGRTYAKVLPDIPRRTSIGPSRTCHQCWHWSTSRCGLGYPDPAIEGARFAVDCDDFRVQ